MQEQAHPSLYPVAGDDHLSAPKSQIAIATIFHRKGRIEEKFRRKSAIFARDSQNEIASASDGHPHLEIATFRVEIRNRNRKNARYWCTQDDHPLDPLKLGCANSGGFGAR